MGFPQEESIILAITPGINNGNRGNSMLQRRASTAAGRTASAGTCTCSARRASTSACYACRSRRASPGCARGARNGTSIADASGAAARARAAVADAATGDDDVG